VMKLATITLLIVIILAILDKAHLQICLARMAKICTKASS